MLRWGQELMVCGDRDLCCNPGFRPNVILNEWYYLTHVACCVTANTQTAVRDRGSPLSPLLLFFRSDHALCMVHCHMNDVMTWKCFLHQWTFVRGTTGGFPSQETSGVELGVSFGVYLNTPLTKQWSCRWSTRRGAYVTAMTCGITYYITESFVNRWRWR